MSPDGKSEGSEGFLLNCPRGQPEAQEPPWPHAFKEATHTILDTNKQTMSVLPASENQPQVCAIPFALRRSSQPSHDLHGGSSGIQTGPLEHEPSVVSSRYVSCHTPSSPQQKQKQLMSSDSDPNPQLTDN